MGKGPSACLVDAEGCRGGSEGHDRHLRLPHYLQPPDLTEAVLEGLGDLHDVARDLQKSVNATRGEAGPGGCNQASGSATCSAPTGGQERTWGGH